MAYQMADTASALALSTEDFSQQEIDAAYQLLVCNQEAFFSDTSYGHRLRQEVIEKFKKDHLESKTFEQLAIQADLADDVDVKNALYIEMMTSAAIDSTAL